MHATPRRTSKAEGGGARKAGRYQGYMRSEPKGNKESFGIPPYTKGGNPAENLSTLSQNGLFSTEGVTYRRREVAWRTRSRVNTPPPPSRTPQSGCAHDTGPAEPLARSARADRPISGLGASLGSRGLPDVSAEGRCPLQGVLYTSCSTCSQHPIDESTYCEQSRVLLKQIT